jgi:hypothetical protein
VDLSLYNNIIDTVHHHTTIHNTDFAPTKIHHHNEPNANALSAADIKIQTSSSVFQQKEEKAVKEVQV